MDEKVRQLEQLNAELETIFEYSFEGILLTDADGTIINVNNVSASFMGLPKEEVIGQNVRDLEKRGIFSPSAAERVIEEGNPVELVQKLLGGRYLYVRSKPIFDENGKIKRVISFTRDLSEIMLLKKQIEEMEDELNKYRLDFPQQIQMKGIYSRSEKMKKTLNHVHKLARVDSDVLLLGETGAGKTEIAKVIHQLSRRKDKPFHMINCAALPESLIEIELFGYKGGMFTGGDPGGKKGLFETANGGTIFLDEIGELPIHLQAKLLHVIQERQLRPVGGTEQLKLDVRIITATNRNLREMIQAGLFREDLYHRITIFPITIPALRERKEDILDLAHQFLQGFNKLYHKQVSLSPKVLESFLSYSWEGNVRELKNLIERLVVLSDYNVVQESDLPEYIQASSDVPDHLTLKEIIDKVESSIILKEYEREKSSYKVAEKLGISQTAAARKIKKYLG
ncbi:sigma-54-dependent Fis family transcriptional regulator [Neobacillus mesonae]|uniref:sigma-54 interaction domain-containing protein n=1 Tax=Neobacillus mesonae TaxID=1193713 RepID=UPI00203E862D|nr:sigma 54-interacting transcriptional regulator [Neobacillus mesonae]MCM3568450.1 sigma 54-interacting transcriptional regulator [Neobacillus mesonae]